jgi:hypothetical protein
MGYVEMIKVTDDGHVALIFKDGEIHREKAEKCDVCYRYRPTSKVMTRFIGVGDDWILECDECQ